ncbi:hypothetical protein [Neorhizobium sp. T7_12]|uniref:hypothetical protein n=1 Tax=Neorhizobium sp. T7_12 TaxID=2093832 RepID=UPI00155F11E4|nr:hypothetical protein [Neorhizobium sp. T7_12]
MSFIVRKCVRCSVTAQLDAQSIAWNRDGTNSEIFFVCTACKQSSIYPGQPHGRLSDLSGNLDDTGRWYGSEPIVAIPEMPKLSDDIPERARAIFHQAALCRKLALHDAAGAMFRKTIDVATKLIYSTDLRLAGKQPATAPRSRVEGLKNLKIIDEDI